MLASLAYFMVLLAACSCQTNTPTDPKQPANVSGIFYRFYQNDVTQFQDVPLQKGTDLLKLKGFDKTTTTIIFVQSWAQNAYSPAVQQLVQAYLKTYYINVVVFDWSSINTDPSYDKVAAQYKEVGTVFGKQICELCAAGLSPHKIELIGFSLGAHVAGLAGSIAKKFNKILYRIVALDAFAALFYYPQPIYRPIDEDDARQTIAIHTSGTQYGVYQRICKVDFYVNKGTPYQPGCSADSVNMYCNHIRSWQVFVASIGNPKLFRAARAGSYQEFSLQTCKENAKKKHIYMGDKTDQKLRGTFYLTTDGVAPYGKGDEGLCT